MLNITSRTWIVVGSWLAALTILMAVSVTLGASRSTTLLLLGIALAPALVLLLIGGGAPSPTVTEILRSVNADAAGDAKTSAAHPR